MQIGNAQLLGDREEQQDYFAIPRVPEGLLVILADGMGGQNAGAVASQIAGTAFAESFSSELKQLSNRPEEPGTSSRIPRLLEECLEYANSEIAGQMQVQPELDGMGTTFVSAFFHRRRVYWISAGDSPFFRLRNGRLERINANHSLADEFDKKAALGEMSAQEARDHPDRHMVTSGLTGGKIPLIDLVNVGLDIEEGDRFVVASDGIHTLFDGEIEGFTENETTAQSLAERLSEAVKGRQAKHQDNTTIVTVFEEDEPEDEDEVFLQQSWFERLIEEPKRLMIAVSSVVSIVIVLVLLIVFSMGDDDESSGSQDSLLVEDSTAVVQSDSSNGDGK